MSDHGHSHGSGGCGGGGGGGGGGGDGGGGGSAANDDLGDSSSERVAFSRPLLLGSDGTLAGEWARAEALYFRVVDGGHAEEAPLALGALVRAAELERSESVFSPGETVEDHPTASLKYLLSDYYLGSLLAREAPGAARKPALRRSRAYLERFIERAINMKALPISGPGGDVEWRAEFLRGSGADGDGEIERGARGCAPRVSSDMGATRNAKIERFRLAQACRKRLAAIGEERTRAAVRLARSGGADAAADGVGGGQSAGAGGMDDAMEREWAMLSLESAARAAVDDLASQRAEAPLIALADEEREREWEREGGSEDRDRDREGRGSSRASGASAAHSRAAAQDGRAQARGEAGGGRGEGPPPGDLSINPRRPGLQITTIDPTFEIRTETVRASIYRSGHNAPTMGLEEWGGKVIEMTREREGREKVQGERRTKTMVELVDQGLEDDEDLFDKATIRLRGFEDW